MHNLKAEKKESVAMNNWNMYVKSVSGAVLFASLILVVSVSVATAEEGVESSDTAGKTLVEKKCTICHSIDRVYTAEKTHSEWEQTVAKMIRYSDQMNFLNQKEKEIVIDFLAGRKKAGGEQP
jgi:cytochrome c5